MARYVTTMRTSKTPNEAFAYLADLRDFADWDPGVKAVRQVHGSGGGPGTVFDVTVAGIGRDLTLRYVTEEHDAPRNLLVVARSTVFTSIDRITVEPDGTGSVVTYDADLSLEWRAAGWRPRSAADVRPDRRPCCRRSAPGSRCAGGVRMSVRHRLRAA